MSDDIYTLTRGDTMPVLQIQIFDSDDQGNFSSLDASMCKVLGEMRGSVVFEKLPVSVMPSGDGLTADVFIKLDDVDTDEFGRMYVTVVVDWPSGQQTFPQDGPLIVDIRRAPGDA